MIKRIGSKLYDTDKGILVLPEKQLYKQPKNRTFYTFDGTTITPITFAQAAEWIHEGGDPEAEKYLEVKKSDRGCISVGVVTADRFYKLERYAHASGRSMKSVIEEFIDSLPEA